MHGCSLPRLRRRLGWAAILTTLIGSLVATVLGMAAANRLLQPELEATGAAVANGLVRDLTHASELGIPLKQYLGMDAYLRSVVDDAPTVRMVAVRDTADRILYRYGADAGWSLYDVTVPLVVQGVTTGSVQVGLDRLVYLSYLAPEAVLIIAVTLAAMLGAVWLTIGLASARLFEPLAGAGRALVRGGRGDFRIAPRRVGVGAPRALVETIAQAIRLLRHDWQGLQEHAMAARAAHFDPAMLGRVDDVTEQVAGRFHLPAEDATCDTGLAARAGLRLATYLLVGAEAACLPSLATSPRLIFAAWVAALAVLAVPAGVTLVAGRSAVISGALVAALGYLASAGLDADAGEIGARLVVGFGLGLAFRGLGRLHDGSRGLFAVPLRHDAVLSGLAVGAVFGGLLAATLSADAAYVLAALSASGTVLVGRWLPQRSPGAERTGRRMVIGLTILLGGLALALGASPLAQWTGWTGWRVEAFAGVAVAALAGLALGVSALFLPRRRRC